MRIIINTSLLECSSIQLIVTSFVPIYVTEAVSPAPQPVRIRPLRLDLPGPVMGVDSAVRRVRILASRTRVPLPRACFCTIPDRRSNQKPPPAARKAADGDFRLDRRTETVKNKDGSRDANNLTWNKCQKAQSCAMPHRHKIHHEIDYLDPGPHAADLP